MRQMDDLRHPDRLHRQVPFYGAKGRLMSRMADRMLTGTIDVPHWVRADLTKNDIARLRDTMCEALASVPIVVIDNVCEYLYAGTS
jgi:hypothetical protein